MATKTATKTVTLLRARALAVAAWCGWKSGTKWDNDRLATKMRQVKDVMPEGTPDDEDTAEALMEILAGIEDKVDFEVVADITGEAVAVVEEVAEAAVETKPKRGKPGGGKTKKPAAKKPKKLTATEETTDEAVEVTTPTEEPAVELVAEKAAEKVPAKAKPVGVRRTENRAFFAAKVIKKHGMEVGVTPEMVAEVDELVGRANEDQTIYALRTVWHALQAWEDQE